MDRDEARGLISDKYLNGDYAKSSIRLAEALLVVDDVFNSVKIIEAKELNDDADIRVPNWELVGQKVFILRGVKIVERTLNKITVSRDSSGLTVQTSILYRCDSDVVSEVYRTREACAVAWLKEQGITSMLRDLYE